MQFVNKKKFLIRFLRSLLHFYPVNRISLPLSNFYFYIECKFLINNKIVRFLGNIRRFRRICEHIQSQVCSKRFSGPGINSPPRVTNAVSESSSCGSDSSERLSCYKRQVK